jgi:Tol biopolymer transport system component
MKAWSLILLAALGVLACTATAQASYPGRPGVIAYFWSPDGSWIVYNRATDGLYRVRPSGRGHARLTDTLGADMAWQPLR